MILIIGVSARQLMILAIYFIPMFALATWLIWCVAKCSRDYIVIALLTVPFFPLLAITVTGDMSRYLPATVFSNGASGKDQIVVVSALTTLLFAVMLAAITVYVLKALWRNIRSSNSEPSG